MKTKELIYKLISLLAVALFTVTNFVLLPAGEVIVVEDPAAGLYSIDMPQDGRNDFELFTNWLDGYQIEMPVGMQVDMSYSEVCTILTGSDTRIEIYRQELGEAELEGYIGYSDSFIANENIKLYFDGSITAPENDADIYQPRLTVWSREKLSGVKGDMNSYACAEIPALDGKSVFTVFLKTADKIDAPEDYFYLIESFKELSEVEAVANEGNTLESLKLEPYIAKSRAADIDKRGWNVETASFYEKYFSDYTDDLTWGIFEPQTSRLDYSQMEYYEDYFKYRFPCIVNYTQFEEGVHQNLEERLRTAWNNGHKVLELTLQTVPTEEGNMLYDVLSGHYDKFLKNYAEVVADFGHPVVFRLMNEMNGDWCMYSALHTSKDTMVYKAAYRYIHDIFEKAGALDNTIWVWNPNSRSYPNYNWNHTLMYYPGDEYVDLIGMTAYNTGAYYSEFGESWTEFADNYDEMYENYCEWFGQPLMITEFACAGFGGDKAAWIEDMFDTLSGYDRVKMAIWWDGCDWDIYGNVARSYFLDESDEVMQAFNRGLHRAADTWNSQPQVNQQRSTALRPVQLSLLKRQLELDRRAAFEAGTTVEEYRGTGSINTRPDWLIIRSDGTFGYSEEKMAELIAAGYGGGNTMDEETVQGHSAEALSEETILPEETVTTDIEQEQPPQEEPEQISSETTEPGIGILPEASEENDTNPDDFTEAVSSDEEPSASDTLLDDFDV